MNRATMQMAQDYLGRIKELEKENAELKKINSETLTQLNLDNGELIIENEKLRKENAELKDLIKNIIRVTWGEGWNYSLDWKVKAEQFLKEIEK